MDSEKFVHVGKQPIQYKDQWYHNGDTFDAPLEDMQFFLTIGAVARAVDGAVTVVSPVANELLTGMPAIFPLPGAPVIVQPVTVMSPEPTKASSSTDVRPFSTMLVPEEKE